MTNKSDSNDIFIDIIPWTSNGFTLKELSMVESIGGDLSGGEAEFFIENRDDDSALKYLTDLKSGIIVLNDDKGGGNQYEPIPLYINSRKWTENSFRIKFICVPGHLFYDKPETTEFEDINEALSTIYPGEVEKELKNIQWKTNINSKSDINNQIKIFQKHETGYDLCTRLCYSFKNNTVFGYGWEGLFIKDIPNPKEDASSIIISGDGNISPISPYDLKYSYALNNDPIDMDEAGIEEESNGEKKKQVSKYSKGILDSTGNHHIVGADYYQLVDNYLWNKRFMDQGFRASLVLKGTDMPRYKLGDTVEYRAAKDNTTYPFHRFVVASNELYYSTPGIEKRDDNELNFSWTTTLFGIDDGEWSKD